jgi:hypothetical protein
MGMRLIKNISPTGIKVNISVVQTDGQSLSVELNHGESILVNDTGAATKSIIIQKRKGNIDIIDETPEGMVPYQKYSSQKEAVESEEIDTGVIEKEQETYSIPEEHFENGPTSIEGVTTESETVTIDPPKNKGGRPKGSYKKKGPGRPKKKKKQSKTSAENPDTTPSAE